MDGTKLLNSRELASELSCSHDVIERLARQGAIPHFRIGRTLRFDLDLVRAALLVAGP